MTYTPNGNYCGNDSFTYTITGGDSATVAVTVTCVDDNPVAVNDAATVLEDSSNNAIDVLANDTDIDGGPKDVTAVTQPSNGTSAFTASGVTYTPSGNYCGNDSFTYSITGGDSATVAVTVDCVNDQPSFDNDDAIYIALSQINSLPTEKLACNFVFGPSNESSQSVNDFTIIAVTDSNNILSSVDVLNNGTMSYAFTGNTGVATVSIALQDNGGIDFGGVDTSTTHQFNIHVEDSIFRNGFDLETCQN